MCEQSIMSVSTVVVGAGIGGLYVAYQLLKSHHGSVIVLEKGEEVGGRVFTYKDASMRVEAGAGRFSKDHTLFIQLLKEFDLSSLVVQNGFMSGHYHTGPSGSVCFIPQSQVDAVKRRLISFRKKRSDAYLRSVSLIEFARSVLSKEDAQFLLDSFGYYSELVLMNAYDCIRLMGELDSRHYSLRGGLSLVIRELSQRIRRLGGKISVKKEVREIHDTADGFSIRCRDGTAYSGENLVCALSKDALDHLPFFKRVATRLTRGIVCAPLCRIYARYPVQRGYGPWFKGLKKFTVNNELRMVIPISEEKGIIMISYSDNRFADFWKRLENTSGEKGVNRMVQKKIKEVLGIDIPDAKAIRSFYWSSGVGYWTPGTDSDAVARQIIRPFPEKNVFVCGENFSAKYQQWMEGALETGSRVVDLIRRR